MAPSRIDDLRRRVEADPASIAFAQLAEEYRRAGQTEEAVRVCREGLTRHPGYLSARVTLGRALLDLGQLDDARLELQFVASEAPENLAAVRGLAEIFHRDGDAAAALEHFQRALALARHDPELEEIVQQLSRQVGAEAGPSNGLTFEEAHQELLSAADRLPPVTSDEPETTAADEAGGATAPFNFDTLVAALGTPAAPPQVEAVVQGETPPVFELPELPEGADPFAALEAELRGQVELPGEPACTRGAARRRARGRDPARGGRGRACAARRNRLDRARLLHEDPATDLGGCRAAAVRRRRPPRCRSGSRRGGGPEDVAAEDAEDIAVGATVVEAEVVDRPAEPGPDADPVTPEAPLAAADPEPAPTISAAERSETLSLVARSEREGNDTMRRSGGTDVSRAGEPGRRRPCRGSRTRGGGKGRRRPRRPGRLVEFAAG